MDGEKTLENNLGKNDSSSKREKVELFTAWVKENKLLFLILLLGIILRWYLFVKTANQPIWWDESDYLAYAKNLAGYNVDWIVSPKHNTLYYYLVAALFKLGASGVVVKFILQLIPSILSIYLVYLISDSMYKDKRIALISTFLFSVFWAHIFNTMRFHVGIPALFTGLLAIYVFWKGYVKQEKFLKFFDKKWAIPVAVILTILTYTIRRGYFLFGAFFLVFMLTTNKPKKLYKDRQNWYGLVIALALFIFSEQVIFSADIAGVSEGYFHAQNAINLLPLDVFVSYFSLGSSLLQSLAFYLFWAGLIIMCFTAIQSLKKIWSLSEEQKADYFNVLCIVITLGFFIFVLRSQNLFGEARWYFPLLLPSLIAIAKSSTWISDIASTYHKQAGAILLVLLIAISGYYQLQHANSLTLNRAQSYTGIRDAGLYIKDISSEDDIVVVVPEPQLGYYSERETVHPRRWINCSEPNPGDCPMEPVFEKIREEPRVRYLVVSFSEPNHPFWMKRQSQTTWEIPFMDTVINLQTGQQDIKQSKTFEDLTFTLSSIQGDVFIYEITRSS